MIWKRWLLGAGAAMALGVAAAPVQAAPAGSLATSGLSAAASEGGVVEKVHRGRRCWRHRGHWHCQRTSRRYRPHYYYGGYYPRRYRYYRYRPAFYGYGPAYYGGYYPRRYRYRPGVSFYGPGFGFSFGPRYRYW